MYNIYMYTIYQANYINSKSTNDLAHYIASADIVLVVQDAWIIVLRE